MVRTLLIRLHILVLGCGVWATHLHRYVGDFAAAGAFAKQTCAAGVGATGILVLRRDVNTVAALRRGVGC